MTPILRDAIETLCAALMLFPWALVPGYMFGSITDVFAFRKRSLPIQTGLSGLFSIALSPLVLYYLFLLGGTVILKPLTGVLVLPCCWIFLKKMNRSHPSVVRDDVVLFAFLLAAWMVLSYGLNCTIQTSNGVYLSGTAIDYKKHAAVAEALAAGGVPPMNPFLFPQHPIHLFYYYWWFLLPAVPLVVGGGAIAAPNAVLAAELWTVSAFLVAAGIIVKKFANREGLPGRAPWFAGMLLLLVGGLDCIPVLIQLARAIPQKLFGVPPTAEWWNEQVDGWTSALSWVPHHMAAFAVCLAVFLIVLEPGGNKGRRVVVGTALLLAGSMGMSIYIGGIAALVLALWALWKRDGRTTTLPVFVSLAAAGILVLPFALELQRSLLTHIPAVTFAVRKFEPLERMYTRFHVTEPLLRAVLNLAALPVNYALELGFFGLGGALYWHRRRAEGRDIDDWDRFWILAALVPFLICSFARSSLRNNDLGWRGFLFVQMALLLWSIPPLLQLFKQGRGMRHSAAGLPPVRKTTAECAFALLLGLGIVTTMCDVYFIRCFHLLSDRAAAGACNSPFVLGTGAEHTRAMREVYEQLRNESSREGRIQYNPQVRFEFVSSMYSGHPAAYGDIDYAGTFGVPDTMVAHVFADLYPLFSGERNDPDSVNAVCRSYGIVILVFQDMDPIWKNPQSWIWTFPPAYSSPHYRVFKMTK